MKRLLPIAFITILVLILSSCGKKDEPEIPVTAKDIKRTILVYAINHSSLAGYFRGDRQEMTEGLKNVDLSEYKLLLFQTDSNTECGLYEASKTKEGGIEFKLVKKFQRDLPSTHPDRIGEVLNYSLNMYPESKFDLIFWGHGMSWQPYFTDHIIKTNGMVYGYGGEYNPNGSNTDWTEIDELAAAVPSNRFETIWFDCCYMTGIEVIYQFRNKCHTFVGYPTEVWGDGAPYDLILPHLLCENPDVTEAAKSFYDYFNSSGDPVTVAVVDMAGIEDLATYSREILKSGNKRPAESDLLNYSRSKSSPFYDFGQFYKETAISNGQPELAENFNQSLHRAVIYHAESEFNFNNRPWDVNNISGLNTHYYKGGSTKEEEFYRTLDWFKKVYE